jgi:hypothetical protein
VPSRGLRLHYLAVVAFAVLFLERLIDILGLIADAVRRELPTTMPARRPERSPKRLYDSHSAALTPGYAPLRRASLI